jgi:spore coat polysaccharide biosynthesis protein SpsF (cytidylyltransferase family)
MKIGAIVLARFDSQRLPGKALRQVGDRALLGYAFDVCRRVTGVDVVLLATTTREVDEPLVEFARAEQVTCVRGDADDVADRFLSACDAHGLDAALRMNGDSPFNRPALLAEAVCIFRRGDADLVTNVPGRSYPFGVSAEVVATGALRAAYPRMTPANREHVTQYFYEHPDTIRMHRMSSGREDLRGVQLAVDDAADLERFARLHARLGERFWSADVVELCALAREHDDAAGTRTVHA